MGRTKRTSVDELVEELVDVAVFSEPPVDRPVVRPVVAHVDAAELVERGEPHAVHAQHLQVVDLGQDS